MNHIDTSYLRRWKHLDQAGRIAAIVKRRDAGMSRKEIMASLDVGNTNLGAFCLRHNIDGLDSIKPTGGWYDLPTEDKIARVEGLRAQHKVTSQIALDLGISTNTLIGFMWRNKVKGVSEERIVIRRPPPEAYVLAEPVRAEVWAPLAEPQTVEANLGCCWPVDTPEGQRCCGAPKQKRSYCAAHYSMAYRPTRAANKSMEDILVAANNSLPSSLIRSAGAGDRPSTNKRQWRSDDE